MKIYNQDKTEILEDVDLEKGYLVEDCIVTHIDYVPAVEEVSHVEVIHEYPNGGTDLQRVIDVEAVPEVPEHDEKEFIQVYIPYTEEELTLRKARLELRELESYLYSSDYKAIKCGELGLSMKEEYPEDYDKRIEVRARINELRKTYPSIVKEA